MKKASTYKQRLIKEVIITSVGLVITFVIFVYFEVHEKSQYWLIRYEYLELDEIMLVLALGSVAFGWFAYRRWRELASELEKSNSLNKQLTEALDARKRARKALSASWRRFVDIAEMSPDWIWECDEKLHFKYVSDHFITATGMARKKILRRRWDEIGARSGLKDLCENLDARRPFHDLKISMPLNGGKMTQWLISGRPVFCDAGEFKGYRGIGAGTAEVKLSGEKAGEYSDHLEEWINLAVMDDTKLDAGNVDVDITPREREILSWVKQGKSYADIGEILSISRRTVEFHIGNVMNKLGASNRVSAVVIAMRRGILGA